MRIGKLFSMILVLIVGISVLISNGCGRGEAPAEQQPAGAAPAANSAGSMQVHANLNQLMRGIMFPNSNIFFVAQSQDPGTIKPHKDPTLSPNPLTGIYRGWGAIENSGLAMAEAANLLMIPGRVCSNGKPAPINNADWPGFVQGLRDAGLAAYKAAQSKDMDMVVEAADQVTTACLNCHNVYREKAAAADRCTTGGTPTL
jgi:hypothetical protein